jgi:hypothetical protein
MIGGLGQNETRAFGLVRVWVLVRDPVFDWFCTVALVRVGPSWLKYVVT